MAGGDGSGRVVVLVASDGAAREGWGADAAVGIARSWSEQGHRVMLVDAGLDAPSLHAAVGLQNREGLSDATLFGASVSRVAQQVGGPGLFLITAGTPVGDAQAVVRSGRWHRLSAGILDAGVTLVLYVRGGEGVAAAFLGSASDIIVLAAAQEAAPAVVRDLEPLVRAVTGPGEPMPAAAEAGIDVAPLVEEAFDDGDALFEGSPGLAPTPGKGGTGRMMLFVVLMVTLAAVLGYLFWQGVG